MRVVNNEVRVEVYFRCPRIRTNIRPIIFVVDTGSTMSMLSYMDSFLLNMPFNFLAYKKNTDIANCNFDLYELHDARFGFTDENNILFRTEPQRFLAAQVTKRTIEKKRDAAIIPSIIGMDFMEKNNFALYCNAAKKIAYFETE